MTRRQAAQKPRPSRQKGAYCKIGSIRVPREMKEDLMAASRKLGLSISEVVRGVLELHRGRLATIFRNEPDRYS